VLPARQDSPDHLDLTVRSVYLERPGALARPAQPVPRAPRVLLGGQGRQAGPDRWVPLGQPGRLGLAARPGLLGQREVQVLLESVGQLDHWGRLERQGRQGRVVRQDCQERLEGLALPVYRVPQDILEVVVHRDHPVCPDPRDPVEQRVPRDRMAHQALLERRVLRGRAGPQGRRAPRAGLGQRAARVRRVCPAHRVRPGLRDLLVLPVIRDPLERLECPAVRVQSGLQEVPAVPELQECPDNQVHKDHRD